MNFVRDEVEHGWSRSRPGIPGPRACACSPSHRPLPPRGRDATRGKWPAQRNRCDRSLSLRCRPVQHREPARRPARGETRPALSGTARRRVGAGLMFHCSDRGRRCPASAGARPTGRFNRADAPRIRGRRRSASRAESASRHNSPQTRCRLLSHPQACNVRTGAKS